VIARTYSSQNKLSFHLLFTVPREPFSFGGLYGTRSKFGDLDITGDGGMEFFSNRIKVTSRWPSVSRKRKADGVNEGTTMNGNTGADKSTATSTDRANFAGTM
jgi:malonate-semialdehyde dehydrogenase (acetylating) / methylmalonate-semialdehyde dehydrogenase